MSNEFKGKIGRTIPESKPWWADYPRPRDGAPNVLVVLFDDLGQGAVRQVGHRGSHLGAVGEVGGEGDHMAA